MNMLTDGVSLLLGVADHLDRAARDASGEDAKELRAQAEDARSAATAIVKRRSARDAEQDRAAKHEASLADCSSAKEEVERLTAALENAQSAFATVESRCRNASDQLAAVQRAEPKSENYPTARELSKWRASLETVEALNRTVVEARRPIVEERDRVAAALAQARGRLTALAFRERSLRPRPATDGSRVELSRVNVA
jgi:chromosome segregation ATPase